MPSYDIKFKKMLATDLKLLHLWFQLPHVLKWYARDEQYTFEMLEEKYLPRINDKSIQSFIISDHDKPVGYIQFYHVANHYPEGIKNEEHPIFNDFKAHELVGIDLFIADEKYLHSGFGTEALKNFINNYIQDKFKAILVDPDKKNSIAIHFFEKNGFRHIFSQDVQHDLMLNDCI